MEDRTVSYEEFNAARSPLLPEDRGWMIAPAVFAGLTFLMFVDVLFSSHKTISHISTDLTLQFLTWRDFGFSELAKGNLPLWNPYIYGGAPYFAGFQSALLYPPNWLHLIMPVPAAITWIVALHVFLLGYFVYLWCRGNAVGTSGSILAGVMYMFCGPYFLHLYAGHLPHLAVMVWTPLILMCLDRIAQSGEWRWVWMGILVTSMHILAGHPQYVYYTGMAVTAYTALKVFETKYRSHVIIGFVGMYLGAVLLTAVQLFAGIEAAGESVRNTGLDFGMAATFSLPPKNLLTLLAPGFFSNMPMVNSAPATAVFYWGAGYLWELSLFVSVTGLVLAILAVVRSSVEAMPGEQLEVRIGREVRARRHLVLPLIMILFTFVLALGRHTPLYKLMYNYLPGYSGFRGTVKFASIMMLFVTLLAGIGFDGLLRNRKVNYGVVGAVGGFGLLMFIIGGIISATGEGGSTSVWGDFVIGVIDAAQQGQELFNENLINRKFDRQFLQTTAEQASMAVIIAGLTLAVVAVLLGISRMNPLMPYSLLLLVVVEMFVFARSTRATIDMATIPKVPEEWAQVIKQTRAKDKDARFLTVQTEFANAGMDTALPFGNLNGYDPGILRTYAEVITASQGVDRSKASQYLPFRALSPQNEALFRALRCGIIFPPPGNPVKKLEKPPLPVAKLYGTWARMGSDDDMLLYMFSGRWQPEDVVLTVNTANVPMNPSTAFSGTVQIVSQDTDHIEFQTNVYTPAMLLVTNNYSQGWRVVPLDAQPEQQKEYWVMRVNYTQMGIPLVPGKHHFRLEYAPAGYRVGWWVSLVASLAIAGWGILLMRRPAWFR